MTMTTDNRGGSIETYTGREFWPLDPRPEDVCLADIAHALSNQCRFQGHVRIFYSVAEHSVRVSELVHPSDALWGLLHDAAEAYLQDVAHPIKVSPEFLLYREAEENLMEVIARKYHLPWPEPASVKEADKILLATEARDLMPRKIEWRGMFEPLKEHIECLEPLEAERRFLLRFGELL